MYGGVNVCGGEVGLVVVGGVVCVELVIGFG